MTDEPILIDVRRVLPGEYRHIWRQALWEQYGRACGICGLSVGYAEFQIDHILQQNLGGSDDWENLRPAHKTCNNGRPRGRYRRAWERALSKSDQFSLDHSKTLDNARE